MPWPKGRKRSAETISKMRAYMLGNTIFLGRRHSESAKRKVSESLYGNTRALGKFLSIETKQRMSSVRRGVRKSYLHKKHISVALKASTVFQTAMQSSEHCENLRASHKKLAQDPTHRTWLLANLVRANKSERSRTRPELLMRTILQALKLPFTEQARFPDVTGIWDFHIQGSKTLIEVDGDYVHANPRYYKHPDARQHRNMDRDSLKGTSAIGAGYQVVRFWESDLRKSPEIVEIVLSNSFGIVPQQLVVVEDALPGRRAAMGAGCVLVPVEGPHEVGPELIHRILAARQSLVGV